MAMVCCVVTVFVVIVAFRGVAISVMVALVVVRGDTARGCEKRENGEKQGFHESKSGLGDVRRRGKTSVQVMQKAGGAEAPPTNIREKSGNCPLFFQ